MAKVIGGLFSLKATKAFGKAIIYQGKKGLDLVFRYHKPGDRNVFTPSQKQIDQRTAIAELVTAWQELTNETKILWENAAEDVQYCGTGYHYFIHRKGQGITPEEPPTEEYLLKETGEYLLFEDSGKIELE